MNFKIHPSETLMEIMYNKGITITELSQSSGMTQEEILRLLEGNQNFSKDVAEKLEKSIGITKTFWMNLQAIYEEEERF